MAVTALRVVEHLSINGSLIDDSLLGLHTDSILFWDQPLFPSPAGRVELNGWLFAWLASAPGQEFPASLDVKLQVAALDTQETLSITPGEISPLANFIPSTSEILQILRISGFSAATNASDVTVVQLT